MPKVVIYTFNDTKDWDSDFNIYKAHSGISLETQFLPNDINLYGNKANSILKPNEHFYSKTTYHISENKVKASKRVHRHYDLPALSYAK